MLGIHDLWLFIMSGLLLNITPGPDVLYILGRSASQGFRAGTWAALGIGGGCLVHIAAAALGMSALLATSAMAFMLIKWLGAAYLVYIGLSMMTSRHAATTLTASTSDAFAGHTSHARIFWQGFLTNVLNPKVALFFLAFVPQFIDAGSAHKVTAFLILGAIFNVNATLWNIFVAWMSSRLIGSLSGASTFGLWLNRVLGAFFVGLGVKLALSERD